jgi:hypothetical protein
VNGLSVPLKPLVTMTGRIVTEGFTPNPELRGVPTIVHADPAYGDATLGRPAGGIVGGSGSFRLTGLQAGDYALHVVAPEGHVKSIHWNGRDYSGRPFDASAGRDFADVVITITKAEARVSGTVRNPSGGAEAAAHVLVFPAEAELRAGYGLHTARIRSARTSASGGFTIGALPAGGYLAVALKSVPRDRVLDPSFLAELAKTATPVSVGWGQTSRVTLVLRASER